MPTRRRVQVALLVTAVGAVCLVAVWPLLHKRPRAVPAATVFRMYLADPQARMVAFAPDEAARADPAMLRRQLGVLRERFDGLSLYGCTPQTPEVVDTARALGYRAVLLTVWDPRSESELATAASIVRDEGGRLALAVSIGSEGRMQNRYTLEDMQAARKELLERNAGATAVEMTTTEPWWLYLKPESGGLRAFGEFTSVNIHVVWDTDIVDPALAASWTRDRAEEVERAVGRPLLVREAGLPGGGTSPRDGVSLRFTRAMQAAFWRSWFALGRRPPLVAFEGVDNGDKHWRDFEGSWGLLDGELRPWPAWGAFALMGQRPARP
jgi:hypothetical protein